MSKVKRNVSLAFDVDNVLADSMSVFCEKVSQRLGTRIIKSDIRSHKVVGSVRLPPFEIFRLQDEVWVEWTKIPPTEDHICEKLDALRDKGFHVYVATSRPKRSIGFVRLWLNHIGIPYDNFYALGGNVSKSNLPCDVLVDDAPEHLEAFVKKGGKGFLYDQPWNRGITLANVRRIKSIKEILRYYKIEMPHKNGIHTT